MYKSCGPAVEEFCHFSGIGKPLSRKKGCFLVQPAVPVYCHDDKDIQIPFSAEPEGLFGKIPVGNGFQGSVDGTESASDPLVDKLLVVLSQVVLRGKARKIGFLCRQLPEQFFRIHLMQVCQRSQHLSVLFCGGACFGRKVICIQKYCP